MGLFHYKHGESDKCMFRLRALQHSEHPVAAVYQQWKLFGRRVGGFFDYSTSIARNLERDQLFRVGGEEFTECVPSYLLAPWVYRAKAQALPQREVVVLKQQGLSPLIEPNMVRIYTDGSESRTSLRRGCRVYGYVYRILCK